MRKRICIITFSNISRDGRVLRQIKYLSQEYQIKVIGYGLPHPSWKELPVEFHSIEPYQPSLFTRMADFIYLGLAQIFSVFYRKWYWRRPTRRKALDIALADQCDAFHANDWDTLPIAAMAAEKCGAKLVFDAHEYAPLEFENRWYWPLQARGVDWVLRQYSSMINLVTTVVQAIAERYYKEYGLKAQVIINAPEISDLPIRTEQNEKIHLIYHGVAGADRNTDKMIHTLQLCDQRFVLDFMLTNMDSPYVQNLVSLSESLAPGRIFFHNPVAPEEIVKRISEFDIGFFLLEPNNYNYRVALPNKFFEFIAAGLAVCVGPSPSMAEIINNYGVGIVSPSFDPELVATTLNSLDRKSISQMQQASLRTRAYFNAEMEMGKLRNLYKNLFESQD